MHNKLRLKDQFCQNNSCSRGSKVTIASSNHRMQKQKGSIVDVLYCFLMLTLDTNHPQINHTQMEEGYQQTYDSIKMPSDKTR